MKIIFNTKILIALLFGIALMFSGCERLPTSVTNKNKGTKAIQRSNLGNFGFKIDEQTGNVWVYHNGRLVTKNKAKLAKNGDQEIPLNAIINGDVTLVNGSLRFTQKPESEFNDVNNGGNIRSVTLDFTLNTGSHEFIVPTNITGGNLLGISSSLKTDIATPEQFTIAFEPALATFATYSFFFDLADTF